MKEKSILLVKEGYNLSGVGEHFLQTMLKGYPKEYLKRFTLVNEGVSGDCYGNYFYIEKVNRVRLPFFSSLYYWWFRRKKSIKVALELVEFVRNEQIDVVWVVLNSVQVIEVIRSFMARCTKPVIVQIWDTPEYLCATSKLDLFSGKIVVKSFKEVLKRSEKVVTISDNLSEIYKEKFKVSVATMVFCPPVVLPLPKIESKKKHDIINIVFAGSLYAAKEWNSFCNAIEAWNNSEVKTKITVTCIGDVSRWAKKPRWVNFERSKPIDEAVQVIREADIAYLPYWMSAKHSFTVLTAFPSKLGLYTVAGTPVFYHGPRESTPAFFLKKYNVGVNCSTTKVEDIFSSIKELLSLEFNNKYLNEQKKAVNEVFHPENSSKIFRAVIN